MMNLPTYFYAHDFEQFRDYYISHHPVRRTFEKGSLLWAPGDTIREIYYIESGLIQVSVAHEDGYKKILSFHGTGTVFPGCHRTEFKIERSILMTAITDVVVLAFRPEDYHQMFLMNKDLAAQTLEWYAKYINILIYDSAHQGYNDAITRLCNFFNIYLSSNRNDKDPMTIHLSQDTLADILNLNRVNVSKTLAKLKKDAVLITHRNRIDILDYDKLLTFCTEESL